MVCPTNLFSQTSDRHTRVGPWAMHDGMFQQAHESSYLYANVAEHLMTFEL